MASLPLSEKQHAALVALRGRELTTADLGAAIGTSKGTGTVLEALRLRGLIKYRGGPGVLPGKGNWYLTALGEQLAATPRPS